jgi:hypothetical protein
MVIITINRKTGKEKSVEAYECKNDININEALKSFAACISNVIKSEKMA